MISKWTLRLVLMFVFGCIGLIVAAGAVATLLEALQRLGVPLWQYDLATAVAGLGAVVLGWAGGIWIGYRTARRSEAIDLTRCLGCGYDLKGNTTGLCPECGRAISPWQRAELERL